MRVLHHKLRLRGEHPDGSVFSLISFPKGVIDKGDEIFSKFVADRASHFCAGPLRWLERSAGLKRITYYLLPQKNGLTVKSQKNR